MGSSIKFILLWNKESYIPSESQHVTEFELQSRTEKLHIKGNLGKRDMLYQRDDASYFKKCRQHGLLVGSMG